MPRKQHVVHLTPAERADLRARLAAGTTPTHGSWLNLAELELSALARQCLDRRLPDQPTLAAETAAWAENRNRAGVRIDWRFNIHEARRTLTHLYPIPACDT